MHLSSISPNHLPKLRARSLIMGGIFLLTGLMMTACQGAASEGTPTQEPEAVFTAAAATAHAGLTAQAKTLAAPTFTPAPIETSQPTPTEPAAPAVTPTETPAPSGGEDRAQFVEDITVIDGTTFNAGEQFVKTWRLLNAGTSTWTTDYALVWASGERMGGPAVIPFTSNVGPGKNIDISVTLTAPNGTGIQRGYWLLQNGQGETFGIGPGFDLAFYVEINVVGGDEGSAPTSTPGDSGEAVSFVTVSVDEGSFTGDCPHTFTFTAQVTTSSPTRVTLEIEAGATDPSYQFNLPGPQSFDVGIGTFSFTYFLDLAGAVDGWVRVRTTAPNVVTSNQQSFNLTCQ